MRKTIKKEYDQRINFSITDWNNVSLEQMKTLHEFIYHIMNAKTYFYNEKVIKGRIAEIYGSYDLNDSDKDGISKTTQLAKRAAYLSALKKELKRDLMKEIAHIIIRLFNIEETSFTFFKKLSFEIMGRSVDEKFILKEFANMIMRDNKLEKIAEKRTAKNKITINFNYSDMVNLSGFNKLKQAFSEVNFKNLYEAKCVEFDILFKGMKINFFDMSEEQKAIFLSEYEKEILTEVIEKGGSEADVIEVSNRRNRL
ncbi:hypothetical protein CHO83_004506 [Salmonella enterica subsp. enterica serovar Javiana]|nr:hypothetical protein [Salmonella enterica subsp. enterica serovar Javiana]